MTPAVGGRPPLPPSITKSEEEPQADRPKSRVPELEKHLIDQLSTEEQNSLNSKFKEATEADKKVFTISVAFSLIAPCCYVSYVLELLRIISCLCDKAAEVVT